MVSTPYAPNGLFERIEHEPEETCIYKRMFLDYTYGIDKIYTKEEIDKAKQSPSFEREHNLKYLGKIGNVFHTKDIDAAIEKGQTVVAANRMSPHSMGIDPGWGSSPFGIVITQWIDGNIHVLQCRNCQKEETGSFDVSFTITPVTLCGEAYESLCQTIANECSKLTSNIVNYYYAIKQAYQKETFSIFFSQI